MTETTATIMLAATNASSRTMSAGIPMSSRAIRASSNAVAAAAITPRIRSTHPFMQRQYHLASKQAGFRASLKCFVGMRCKSATHWDYVWTCDFLFGEKIYTIKWELPLTVTSCSNLAAARRSFESVTPRQCETVLVELDRGDGRVYRNTLGYCPKAPWYPWGFYFFVHGKGRRP